MLKTLLHGIHRKEFGDVQIASSDNHHPQKSWMDGHLSGQSSINVDIRLGKVGQWHVRQPADLAKSNTHVSAIYIHFQEPSKNQQRKDCFKPCFFTYLGQGLFTRCDCDCDLFISPQLEGGMGFSVVVTIAPCEHLH